jgi:hypothetical protein
VTAQLQRTNDDEIAKILYVRAENQSKIMMMSLLAPNLLLRSWPVKKIK